MLIRTCTAYCIDNKADVSLLGRIESIWEQVHYHTSMGMREQSCISLQENTMLTSKDALPRLPLPSDGAAPGTAPLYQEPSLRGEIYDPEKESDSLLTYDS